jgi:hypothetical protein
MEIKIFGKNSWQSKAWRHLIKPLLLKEQTTAKTILQFMHDRHVGITPLLAAELAQILEINRREVPKGNAWTPILFRLNDAITFHEQSTIRLRYGLLPSNVPFYSIVRLALPLVYEACRQLGKCYLFSADNISDKRLSLESYEKYANDLKTQLHKITVSDNKLTEIFWKDRAFSIHSQSLIRKNKPDQNIPDVDSVGLAMLLYLEPELNTRHQQTRPLRPRTTLSQFSSKEHRNEGGIDGVHRTSREADMGGILLSEFMQPKPLLLDRLLNTGFFVHRRPPHRDKPRHVLLAALMPWEVKRHLSGHLARASWIDCMAQFAVHLQRTHLTHSEFIWLEGEQFFNLTENRALLTDLQGDISLEVEEPINYRNRFLFEMRWLPGLLNRHQNRRRLSRRAGYENLQDWLFQAWAGQMDHANWQHDHKKHKPKTTQLKIDAFQHVHVMVFLPPTDKNNDQDSKRISLGNLRHILGLKQEHGVSIIRVPVALDKLADWSIEMPNSGRIYLWPETQEQQHDLQALQLENEPLENAIASRLLEHWLKQLIKEVFSG